MDKKILHAKLQNSKDIEDVKAMLAEEGEKCSTEDIERIWQEIEHHRPDDKRKLDPDEMDAVTGGTVFNVRDWSEEGCAATVGPYRDNCWKNDNCILFWEVYINEWCTCPDGKSHEWEYDSYLKKKVCKRCHIQSQYGGADGNFRPSS